MHSIRFTASFAAALSILAVTAGPARGGVIKVDDDGGAGIAFKQIQAAIVNAFDGDVILVESGTYKRFTVDDKSLVIQADVGATVLVTGSITIQNLAAGKSVALRGLDVPGLLSISFDALILNDDAGCVRIEDGNFTGAPGAFDAFGHPGGYSGAVITHAASVAFDRCTLHGGFGASQQFFFQDGGAGGPALQATDSSVVAFDGALLGGAGGGSALKATAGGSGGNGAGIVGGALDASGSLIGGGSGGFAYYGGSGGDGLVLIGGARAQLLGDTLQGGAASSGFGNPGLPGVALDAAGGLVITLNDTPRHFSMNSPSREGDLIISQFNGLPNEGVFLLFSQQLGQQALGPAKETFLLGSAFDRLFLGTTDDTGATMLFDIVPELGPGVDAVTIHCQALFLGTGGGPVLGGMSSELLLDYAL